MVTQEIVALLSRVQFPLVAPKRYDPYIVGIISFCLGRPEGIEREEGRRNGSFSVEESSASVKQKALRCLSVQWTDDLPSEKKLIREVLKSERSEDLFRTSASL